MSEQEAPPDWWPMSLLQSAELTPGSRSNTSALCTSTSTRSGRLSWTKYEPMPAQRHPLADERWIRCLHNLYPGLFTALHVVTEHPKRRPLQARFVADSGVGAR